MNYLARMEYFKAIYQRYRKSAKPAKGKILDEFCKTTGFNRKYAIAKLSGPLETPQRRPRVRGNSYSDEALKIIEGVWACAGYPWSERLVAILRDWAPWIKRHYRPSELIERELLSISARQIDRRLKAQKTRIRRRIYGRTKPGKILKHYIPIRTTHWNVKGPGWVEIDLVAHSGNSAAGEFAFSLNLTDIYTGWVETRAVLGKGGDGIVWALEDIRRILPFPLLGIDSDNGSEFINSRLYGYCVRRGITFTRGRPYAKQDNARIEQKNWTHVRRLMGYDRYNTRDAIDAMNDLYRGEMRLMMNLCQPSVKLLRKERVGSRLRRKHDAPKTPLERLKAWKETGKRLWGLLEQKSKIDPFILAETIDRKLKIIHSLADHRVWTGFKDRLHKRRTRPRRLEPRHSLLAQSGFMRRHNAAFRLDFQTS